MLVTADEKRGRREEWEQRVAEYRASGLSVTQWCDANGVKPQRMWWWLRRVAVKVPVAQPAKWVEAVVSAGAAAAEDSGLVVRVGKASVEVKPGFDALLLCSVVRALSTIC